MRPTEASTGSVHSSANTTTGADVPGVVVSPMSCEDDLDLTLAQLFPNPVAPNLHYVAPDVTVVTAGDTIVPAQTANVFFFEAV